MPNPVSTGAAFPVLPLSDSLTEPRTLAVVPVTDPVVPTPLPDSLLTTPESTLATTPFVDPPVTYTPSATLPNPDPSVLEK